MCVFKYKGGTNTNMGVLEWTNSNSKHDTDIPSDPVWIKKGLSGELCRMERPMLENAISSNTFYIRNYNYI